MDRETQKLVAEFILISSKLFAEMEIARLKIANNLFFDYHSAFKYLSQRNFRNFDVEDVANLLSQKGLKLSKEQCQFLLSYRKPQETKKLFKNLQNSIDFEHFLKILKPKNTTSFYKKIKNQNSDLFEFSDFQVSELSCFFASLIETETILNKTRLYLFAELGMFSAQFFQLISAGKNEVSFFCLKDFFKSQQIEFDSLQFLSIVGESENTNSKVLSEKDFQFLFLPNQASQNDVFFLDNQEILKELNFKTNCLKTMDLKPMNFCIKNQNQAEKSTKDFSLKNQTDYFKGFNRLLKQKNLNFPEQENIDFDKQTQNYKTDKWDFKIEPNSKLGQSGRFEVGKMISVYIRNT